MIIHQQFTGLIHRIHPQYQQHHHLFSPSSTVGTPEFGCGPILEADSELPEMMIQIKHLPKSNLFLLRPSEFLHSSTNQQLCGCRKINNDDQPALFGSSCQTVASENTTLIHRTTSILLLDKVSRLSGTLRLQHVSSKNGQYGFLDVVNNGY